MVSSYSLSQKIATHCLPSSFEKNDSNIHNIIFLAICVIIGICGISSRLRKLAALVIFCVRMVLLSVDGVDHLIGMPKGLSHALHRIFDEPLPFLDFSFIACMLTIALRWVEVKYGPRRIPDTARSLTSLDYLLSLGVRRFRQMTEVFLYTLLPGFFVHAFIFGVDMVTLPQKFGDYCGRGKITDFHRDAESIEFVRDYVLIIITCGMFQRVFGSNPSYKGSIYDQYGRLLSNNDDYEQKAEYESSLWKILFTKVNTLVSKVNAARRSYINHPSVDIYSMGSEQSTDRSQATLKPSRSDKALI